MRFAVTRRFAPAAPGARGLLPAAPPPRPVVTTRTFTVPAPPGARVFLPAAPTEAGCRACPFFLPAHELCRQPLATCPNSPHRHQPWLHLPTCPQLIPAKHLPPETISP